MGRCNASHEKAGCRWNTTEAVDHTVDVCNISRSDAVTTAIFDWTVMDSWLGVRVKGLPLELFVSLIVACVRIDRLD